MKILSVFNKAPKHQRFSYAPRYYDPQKEEAAQREARIKAELARERGEKVEDTGSYRTRIAGSFHTARKRSKSSIGVNAVMLRLGVLLFITVFLIAFLEWGRPVLYSLLLFIPFYLYLKFKK